MKKVYYFVVAWCIYQPLDFQDEFGAYSYTDPHGQTECGFAEGFFACRDSAYAFYHRGLTHEDVAYIQIDSFKVRETAAIYCGETPVGKTKH